MLPETGSELGTQTLDGFMDYFRNLCPKLFLRHPLKIGILGKIVEIDETFLTNRKCNWGRVVEKQWFFEVTERGTNKRFVVAMERRDAATLLPLIRQYVVPGTTFNKQKRQMFVFQKLLIILSGIVNNFIRFGSTKDGDGRQWAVAISSTPYDLNHQISLLAHNKLLITLLKQLKL